MGKGRLLPYLPITSSLGGKWEGKMGNRGGHDNDNTKGMDEYCKVPKILQPHCSEAIEPGAIDLLVKKKLLVS